MDKAQGLYARFERLLSERGISRYKLSKDTGVSQATLTSWKNGAYTPKLNKLELIASYLDIPLSELMGEESERRLPILGDIACGTPIFAQENIEGYASQPYIRDADFCLVAKGDSMIGARIYEGDLVFIKRQSAVENGEIGAVLIDECATLKRVYYYPSEGKLILSPENPKYEPLVFIGKELESITILGKAVAFQSII